MCGIADVTGQRQAAPILLDGLTKLENHSYTVYSDINSETVVKPVERYNTSYL